MYLKTDKQNEIAILYSGGTDSTCATAIMAEKFRIIHLLTFKRLGISLIENSQHNIKTLKEKFPSVIFKQKNINTDYLATHLSYNNFIKDIFKYGFLMLSNCILCSLVNHFAALIYCLDNKINKIADGSTKDWIFFPSHMEKAIILFREMYEKFNIDYYTPVYEFDIPAPVRFIDKIYSLKDLPFKNDNSESGKNTTGKYLFNLGFFSSSNIKGTDLDHKMQPRCSQFILHHIYIYWYFMAWHDYSSFELATLKFIKGKIDYFLTLIKKKPQRTKKMIHEIMSKSP